MGSKLNKYMNGFYQRVREQPLVAVLFVLGILFRVVAIASLPPGLNQDEASVGYDAYSILHYGIDRNGSFLPIHLIAWGSGQNALYAYLSMPFIFIFGLNEFSVRIVSALAGAVTMFLFYAIAKRFVKDPRAAALAAFVIVICPWHLMMSRWALESNLFPTVVLAAVYFAIKALDNPKRLAVFTVLMAVSLYAYGTAYFFAPLFTFAVYTVFAAKKAASVRLILLNGAGFAILALPILLFLIINRYSLNAIEAIATIPKLTVPRVEQASSVFQSGFLSGAFDNMKRVLDILVTQNDGLPWNALPAFGYMYPIAVPLILLGLITTIATMARKTDGVSLIIMLWLAVALAMGFAVSDANINRINIVFYPLLLLVVAGLAWLFRKEKWAGRAAIAVLTVFFAAFANTYVRTYPEQIGPLFFESFGEAIRYASDATDGNVYITDRVNMPYIYVLFYEKGNPHRFIQTVQYRNPGGAFQVVDAFDRYRFGYPEIREGEKAAYLYANEESMPSDESRYTFKRFKHYTVVLEK
ncbi:ArnT family glycosyltransferase [Paenibacillus sp. NPDC058071]|uniref:ArnT family glycosyltransferase n=1 Tax=Paenibacillus sp. NPDC058071 TaxID=3346326 RepID=UPI0036DDF476